MDKVVAGALMRNDRVVIDTDEMPYLVDEVKCIPNSIVSVTYSSGDTVEYSTDDVVTIID